MVHSSEIVQTENIDAAHLSRLPQTEQESCMRIAQGFMRGLGHTVDMAYLHLDVDTFKETSHAVPAYRWRALLITNRGKYHADGWAIGAIESLKVVLGKIDEQMESRLGRIESGMEA